MFIRTTDTTIFYKFNSKKNIYTPFQFVNHKRKNNIIKQFVLNHNNEIDYIADVLKTKMIPKKEIDLFFGKVINVVVTPHNTLIYQDTDENPCRFVTIDEITDNIIPINIYDIVPNETEILCYDDTLEDFYITTIISLSQYIYDTTQPEDDVYNKQYIQQYEQLSKYFIYIPHGVIINNFLLM